MNVNTLVRLGLVVGGLVAAVTTTVYCIGYFKGMFGAAAGDDEYPPYRAPMS